MQKEYSKIELSRLIGVIYDCISHTDKWEQFLRHASDFFHVTGAQIVCSNPIQQKLFFSAHHGFADEHMADYVKYALDDPALPFFMAKPSRVLSDRAVNVKSGMLQSKMSREFLQPLGISERVGFFQDYPDGRALAFALMAGSDRELFTREEIELVSEIHYHLYRAVEIQNQLLAAKYQNDRLVNVLNGVPMGILILDSNCRVLFSNNTAEEIAGNNSNIKLEFGQFKVGDALLNKNFEKAVSDVTDENISVPLLEPEIIRFEKKNSIRDLIITVSTPTEASFASDLGLLDSKIAIVFINDPDLVHETPNELLGRLFGFTKSEAEVAKHLVKGLDTNQIATETGFTRETVRSYLKQMYEKTNCGKQTELVNLIVNSPAWISHNTQRSNKL